MGAVRHNYQSNTANDAGKEVSSSRWNEDHVITGDLIFPGLVGATLASSVTAAGANQGTATAITGSVNIVTSVAAGTGVILPASSAGLVGARITVINHGVNNLLIYPATGQTIDSGSANAPFTVLPGQDVDLVVTSATNWTGMSVNTFDDENNILVLPKHPSVIPQALTDQSNLGALKVAGLTIPAFRGEKEVAYPLEKMWSRYPMSWAMCNGQSTTVGTMGMGFTATGTATAANFATTNKHQQLKRIDNLVTTAATTAVAGFRSGTAHHLRGNVAGQGGFFFTCTWGPATGVATATMRGYCGATSSSATAPTDVEPSSQTNHIGMGWDAADTNVQLMYNAASTTTKVDLGASWPVPTADRTAVYRIDIYCAPNDTTVYVDIYDVVNDLTYSAALTTNIPAATTALGLRGYCSVGGTSSVIGMAIMCAAMGNPIR